jgi:hypothetical protein
VISTHSGCRTDRRDRKSRGGNSVPSSALDRWSIGGATFNGKPFDLEALLSIVESTTVKSSNHAQEM